MLLKCVNISMEWIKAKIRIETRKCIRLWLWVAVSLKSCMCMCVCLCVCVCTIDMTITGYVTTIIVSSTHQYTFSCSTLFSCISYSKLLIHSRLFPKIAYIHIDHKHFKNWSNINISESRKQDKRRRRRRRSKKHRKNGKTNCFVTRNDLTI